MLHSFLFARNVAIDSIQRAPRALMLSEGEVSSEQRAYAAELYACKKCDNEFSSEDTLSME
jgi:hypothetical protein